MPLASDSPCDFKTWIKIQAGETLFEVAPGALCVVDRELLGRRGWSVWAPEPEKDTWGTWFFLGVGAVTGVVLGILVSVTTDVPLAPAAGLILGALVGWLFRRVST